MAVSRGIATMVLNAAISSGNGTATDETAGASARERWERLCNAPEAARWWDWYALLRLLQAATPDYPMLGYGVQLADDPVRLGQPPFFHAPASIVADLAPNGGDGSPPTASGGIDTHVARLRSFHFGLFGPNGPLPLHLTEVAYRQSHQGGGALAAFCDVLHHRFLCYFFRAWADARKEVELDRAADDGREATSSGGQQRMWELYVGSLIGCGAHSLRHRDRVPDHAKLFQAGRLMRNGHNAEGLQAILEDYFGVSVRVIQFFSRRSRLPQGMSVQLGNGSHGWVGRLGLSVFIGQRYIDHQSGFRLQVGPLHLDQFLDFLPGSRGLDELHDWVRLYMGRESDSNPEENLEALWDLQLVLIGKDVPRPILGRGVRLGWTSWLHSKPPPDEVDDLVLRPPSTPPGFRRSKRTGQVMAAAASP